VRHQAGWLSEQASKRVTGQENEYLSECCRRDAAGGGGADECKGGAGEAPGPHRVCAAHGRILRHQDCVRE